MNIWECEYPNCKSKACGIGSAIGLRAIGWHYVPGTHIDFLRLRSGPIILCPEHRWDAIVGAPADADKFQQMIKDSDEGIKIDLRKLIRDELDKLSSEMKVHLIKFF